MQERSYRELHLQKGADYHALFSTEPHLSMVWQLERKLLSRIVEQHFPGGVPAYLDFACGTGRIVELLSPFAEQSTGVDLSASMLQVARERLQSIEFVEADITRDDLLAGRQFDLITAFRFFPRAEPALRQEAMAAIRRHLKPGGVLVFNNHRNPGSLLRRLIGARGRLRLGPRPMRSWGMSRREVNGLLASCGLRVEQVYPIAILPMNDRHMPLPTGVATVMESALARIGLITPLAQNLIFVCRQENQ